MAPQDQELRARSRVEHPHLIAAAHGEAGAVRTECESGDVGRRIRKTHADLLARHIPDLQLIRGDPLSVEGHLVRASRERCDDLLVPPIPDLDGLVTVRGGEAVWAESTSAAARE